MQIHNADIARVFDEIADLLELGNDNPFRIRAYRNAARVVGELREDVPVSLAQGKALHKIPGVGADLAAKMREITATGTCDLLEQLRRRFPAGITELLTLPGLGPRRVRRLSEHGIHSLAMLRSAAIQGRLRDIGGFGEQSERKLLEAANARLSKSRRFKLAMAAQYAEPYARQMGATIAGSYRRMKDTVGDVDFLVCSERPERDIERFVNYGEVKEVLSRGTTRASVLLACGLQVDLRVVPKQSYGAALHYFTGSKSHNIAVRRMAMARGLKVNEYGVYRGDKHIAGETEESVYAAVGLPFIPPELREEQGEIEAARQGRLPRLVQLSDLRGDLHAHTRASDGRNTLREMAEAARARGLEYLTISDHSRHATVARGLDPARLEHQMAEIDELNPQLQGITLLKGSEVDILEDGRLDLPDSVLCRLDVVLGAVHSRLNLPRSRQTERILAALDNPLLAILAHPLGRLIAERAPIEVDVLAIMRKAAERGVFLEVNAQPDRLDLDDVYCRMAKDEGVRMAISSDAHSVNGLDVLRYGVGQARRGWLEKDDVINTRPLELLRHLLPQWQEPGKSSSNRRTVPPDGPLAWR